MSKLNLSELRERISSPVILHAIGTGVLAAVVLVLGVRVALDWNATHGSPAETLATKQLDLKALDIQTAPLRGLDKLVDLNRARADEFYSKRIPASYSAIATRIGELQVKSGARMSRVQYTQGNPGNDLTEISLDASISGSYGQIMHFVNTVERDQNFFIIRAMGLTGQQGGTVNLRIRISTWLRPADAAASGLPTEAEAAAAEARDQQLKQLNGKEVR